MNLTKKIILFALGASLALQSVSISPLTLNNSVKAYAQESSSDIQTREVNGEVLSIKDRTLNIKNGDKTQEYNVPDNIKITRNSMETSLSEIKPRDQVTIIEKVNTNEVVSIEAVAAGEASDVAKFAIPAIILAAIVLGILYYLWQKNQKGVIKTTPTNM